MKMIIKLLISTLSVLVAAYLIPGVTVEHYVTAFIVAIVIGVLNVLIRPVLIILTLPINILTLGLFSFVITAFLVWLAALVVPGFGVATFWTALLFGFVMTVVNWFLSKLVD